MTNLISVRHLGPRPKLPLELLYSVIDVCAQDRSFQDLKNLRLVSRSLNRQARKHIWSHIDLPPKKAIRLDRDGRDFYPLLETFASAPDIPKCTKSLNVASYPPEVLSPFLEKLEFGSLQWVSIHGYDIRVSKTPKSSTLTKLFRTNPGIHTLKISTLRMNPIAFFDFISQSELCGLKHCHLDIVNTTIDDSWEDHFLEPKPDDVDGFLERRRSQQTGISRPSLTTLYLNRITNLPNASFFKALFGHPTHSLFDISSGSLQRLALCISSYPVIPLWHYSEVIDACSLSVRELTIQNWQDVSPLDSSLLMKFINITGLNLELYEGTYSTPSIKDSLQLALGHLTQMQLKFPGQSPSLKKLKFTIQSYQLYKGFDFLLLELGGEFDGLCRAAGTTIECIEISFKSLNVGYNTCDKVFIWNQELGRMVARLQ